MQKKSTIRPLVAGALLVALTAAGCGVSGGGSGARTASAGAWSAGSLTAAGQATSDVTSQRVSITVSTAPADGEPTISVTSEGAVDVADGQAQLTADVSGSLGGRGGDTTIEAVYDGDTVYLKAPFVELFSNGKPWVKVTSDRLADAVADLGTSVQPDPGSVLTFLQGAGGPVEDLGAEDVRGVPTSHLGVSIDPAKLLAKASPAKRKALEGHLDSLGISLDQLGKLPAEAWIDEGGYVRRFSVSYDLGNLNAIEGPGGAKLPELDSTITETIELWAFNEPVDVQVPSASEVHELDLSKLFGD